MRLRDEAPSRCRNQAPLPQDLGFANREEGLSLALLSQLRTIFGVFAISFAVKLRVSIAQL